MIQKPGPCSLGFFIGALAGFVSGITFKSFYGPISGNLTVLWFALKISLAFGLMGAVFAWLRLFKK